MYGGYDTMPAMPGSGVKKSAKVALITGITGQDGSYLAEFLLKKGYIVHGIKRRASSFNTERINHLFKNKNFFLHYGDMTDSLSLMRIMAKVRPHELYNLAAQSHVQVSFESPEYTANADGMGTLRLLEAIRILKLKTRFYQASTSEMFGNSGTARQDEETRFRPRSPYAAAKLYAYWVTVNYREAYNIFAVNGILFNHESPRRGETFVTRKITMALARMKKGSKETLYLGNLNAKRDWGHAKDYVKMMWLMLQQEKPMDMVAATGEQYSVRDFIIQAARCLGMALKWAGNGPNERVYINNRQRPSIAIDKRYFRPLEVDSLRGDASLAKQKLGWTPEIDFRELVKEMVKSDLEGI